MSACRWCGDELIEVDLIGALGCRWFCDRPCPECGQQTGGHDKAAAIVCGWQPHIVAQFDDEPVEKLSLRRAWPTPTQGGA